jgi:hypothetical protein
MTTFTDACEHFGVREWDWHAPLAVRILRGSDEIDGCWRRRWVLPTGYSTVSRPGGRVVLAHRAMYELMVGPIPEGHDLDHLCHTNDPTCHLDRDCPHRACCNPAHLEPVTERENTLRGTSPAAENARKTHCKRGHEFTPENTYVVFPRANGLPGRGCRTCRIEYHRARRAAA